MSKKKEKQERRFGVWWNCPNCKDSPEFTTEQIQKHIREVHGVKSEKIGGKRSMIMHMDGSNYFSSVYEWEIEGLKYTQSTCHKRTGENAALWGDGKEDADE